MRKYLSAIFISLCMALILLPGTVRASSTNLITGKYGDLDWEYEQVLDDRGLEDIGGTLTVRGNGGVPDYVWGESPWSEYSYYISTVIIEDGVTSIGNYGFYDFSNLENIRIPDGVTTIGTGAFQLCNKLSSIVIPNSVTSIGKSAFEDCYSLASITISENATSIGESAFENCSSLTSITIPGAVNSIPYMLFGGCSSLSEVIIQDGVIYIEDNAFYRCSKLDRISIPASVKRIAISPFPFIAECYNLRQHRIMQKGKESGKIRTWTNR